MNDWCFTLVMVLVYAAGAALRRYCSEDERTKRALTDRRRIPLARVEPGPVRIGGFVRSDARLLRAPLSQRPCVAFRLTVYDDDGMGAPSGEVLVVRDAVPFVVADDTGEAQVDPRRDCTFTLACDARGDTHQASPDNPDIARMFTLLEERAVPVVGWLGDRRNFHFSEGTLEPGDLVAVSGQAIRPLRLETPYPTPRLILLGTRAEPLRFSDEAPL
jgi:hypothetical protein